MDALYIALMTLFVIGISYAIIKGTKYLKDNMSIKPDEISNVIDITKLAVNFITKILKDNEFESEKIDKVLPLIINSLEHIKVVSANKSEQEVLADALSMIKELAYEYDINITGSDIIIIQSVLKLANDFYVSHQHI